MDLSYEEKLKLLGLTDHKSTLSSMVDALYFKFHEDRKIVALELLNELLKDMGYDKINDFTEFRVIVTDLKKIDGVEFIDKHKDTFEKMKIDLVKDLQYNTKNKKKVNYIMTVVESIGTIFGYEFIIHRTSAIIKGKTKTLFKCKFEKIIRT